MMHSVGSRRARTKRRTAADGGKINEPAGPEMPAAGAADPQGAEQHGQGRRACHRMHRPAHRNRHSEPAQPDRRHVGRQLAGEEGADVSHSEVLMRGASNTVGAANATMGSASWANHLKSVHLSSVHRRLSYASGTNQ